MKVQKRSKPFKIWRYEEVHNCTHKKTQKTVECVKSENQNFEEEKPNVEIFFSSFEKNWL